MYRLCFGLTSLCLLLGASIVEAKSPKYEFSIIKTKTVDDLHEREVAAYGRVRIKGTPSHAKIKSCIPRESMPFPKSLPKNVKETVFDGKELEDLQACNVKDCKFNFLKEERKQIAEAKTRAELQKLYFQFFRDRTLGKKPLDPERIPMFIRSKDKAFKLCEHPQIDDLLDKRPNPNLPFRFSHINYESRMRPTSRLLQGRYVTKGKQLCYAEAVLFADHYDVDRVEVWSYEPIKDNDYQSHLELQIRHRIDFLRTFWRRLNKPAFIRALKEIIERQFGEVQDCLNRAK